MKSWRLSLLLFVVASPTVFSATDFSYLQSIAGTRYHRVDTTNNNRSYHLYVLLPDNYGSAAESSYPVVYLLDGGGLYPMLAGYYRYLRFAEDVPDAIVVGISYGSDTFEEGNYRSTDFTAPSAERDYWGGAAEFQDVLANEILPLVENTYRADAGQRIIFGQSIGGQFVLYTAGTRPGLFRGHIASNPALHRNLEFFLDMDGSANGRSIQSKLFVSSASNDDTRFREAALAWMDFWESQVARPWALRTVSIAGHNHFSAAPEAFRQGLIWVFAGDTAASDAK
jgi:predicted alpha/beta superfamily hydrolase